MGSSFATTLNGNKYFEKVIRPANIALFGGDLKKQRDEERRKGFLVVGDMKAETYEDKVQRHLDNIEEEDRLEKMQLAASIKNKNK